MIRGHPFVGDLGLLSQRGDGGECHRQRTPDARLLLIEQIFQRGPHDMRPRLGGPPRQGVRFVLHADRHQLVPGGMELDFVDPPSETVVRAQDGGKPVGLETQRDHLGRADQRAKAFEPLYSPLAPLADHSLFEGNIQRERVVVLQGGGLVFDNVRLMCAGGRLWLQIVQGRPGISRGHGVAPDAGPYFTQAFHPPRGDLAELFLEEGQHAFPGAFVGFLVVAEGGHAALVGVGDGEAVLGGAVVVDFVVDVRVVERFADFDHRLFRRMGVERAVADDDARLDCLGETGRRRL